ncbi:CHD3-type chromatin-remodeling factor PICKLE-like [Camellia sinensis]|nr:CHD3-type chromatin-remodeling factor PICKLE-like [Camellia sinensis]
MEFDAQTMNDLPEVEVIPPEEVSAVACDDKPDRLEMAQLYNEMCKVLGQNANESMEAFLANKPAGAECWQLQEQGEKVGKQQIGSHNESNLVQVEEESPSTRDHLSRYKQNPLSSSVGFF